MKARRRRDITRANGGNVSRTADCAVVVVGSINMDLAVRCPRVPAPGETILGSELREFPGGKGANQAVAAGRLGSVTAMVGCIGTDSYAETLRGSLQQSGVDTTFVLERGMRSGVALIQVAEAGENSIVVVPGANALVTPEDVEAALARLPAVRIMLLQLELPLATVQAAAELAKARRMLVMLDPAPVQALPDALLKNVDILTPNEGEAAALAGHAGRIDAHGAPIIAARLRELGPGIVLVKLGGDGMVVADRDSTDHLPGIRVATVDTTAAGDCLAGALASALAGGSTLRDAARFANAAAALSTTRMGAQTSMPTRTEVLELLDRIDADQPGGASSK
jgi:ribokinase